jgi:hypothetical protein
MNALGFNGVRQGPRTEFLSNASLILFCVASSICSSAHIDWMRQKQHKKQLNNCTTLCPSYIPSYASGHPVTAAMNLVLEEANQRLKVPLRSLLSWIIRPKVCHALVCQPTLSANAFLLHRIRLACCDFTKNDNTHICIKTPKVDLSCSLLISRLERNT